MWQGGGYSYLELVEARRSAVGEFVQAPFVRVTSLIRLRPAAYRSSDYQGYVNDISPYHRHETKQKRVQHSELSVRMGKHVNLFLDFSNNSIYSIYPFFFIYLLKGLL